MKIKFSKLQALGNDYIYVDCFAQNLRRVNLKRLSRRICDRHFGVGGDGLILVLPGRKAKFKMGFYNPDGSEAEMCGNGVRCFARFLYQHGLSRKKRESIETKNRLIQTEILNSKPENFQIKVDMGEPLLDRRKIPVKGDLKFCIQEKIKIGGKTLEITSLSMGNPHTVVLVKNFPRNWQKIGALIENHPMFPEKTNVEFCKVLNKRQIELRVWERAAGETLASGTGACSALVTAFFKGKTDRKVEVIFPHGKLKAEWDELTNHLFVTGPTYDVFSGVYCFKGKREKLNRKT
jgi:diaminopimelate epimerase